VAGLRSGPVGTFTDDTQLTIVVARWLVEMGHGDLEAGPLAEAIELWGETGRGIGHATHEALELMRSGRPWWESGVASAGNGAAFVIHRPRGRVDTRLR
jgi:ADP-ribosylglycohydrolase